MQLIALLASSLAALMCSPFAAAGSIQWQCANSQLQLMVNASVNNYGGRPRYFTFMVDDLTSAIRRAFPGTVWFTAGSMGRVDVDYTTASNAAISDQHACTYMTGDLFINVAMADSSGLGRARPKSFKQLFCKDAALKAAVKAAMGEFPHDIGKLARSALRRVTAARPGRWHAHVFRGVQFEERATSEAVWKQSAYSCLISDFYHGPTLAVHLFKDADV